MQVTLQIDDGSRQPTFQIVDGHRSVTVSGLSRKLFIWFCQRGAFEHQEGRFETDLSFQFFKAPSLSDSLKEFVDLGCPEEVTWDQLKSSLAEIYPSQTVLKAQIMRGAAGLRVCIRLWFANNTEGDHFFSIEEARALIRACRNRTEYCSPVWSRGCKTLTFIRFPKRLELKDIEDHAIGRVNTCMPIVAAYEKTIFEVDQIGKLEVVDGKALLTLHTAFEEVKVGCHADSLFRRLSALRDGREAQFSVDRVAPGYFMAPDSEDWIAKLKLPYKLRVAHTPGNEDQAGNLLKQLLPHVSWTIALLPIGAFRPRTSFPVREVVVEEGRQEGGDWLWRLRLEGTAPTVGGESVVLSADLWIDNAAIQKGAVGKHMLFETKARSGDPVWLEIIRGQTIWSIDSSQHGELQILLQELGFDISDCGDAEEVAEAGEGSKVPKIEQPITGDSLQGVEDGDLERLFTDEEEFDTTNLGPLPAETLKPQPATSPPNKPIEKPPTDKRRSRHIKVGVGVASLMATMALWKGIQRGAIPVNRWVKALQDKP